MIPLVYKSMFRANSLFPGHIFMAFFVHEKLPFSLCLFIHNPLGSQDSFRPGDLTEIISNICMISVSLFELIAKKFQTCSFHQITDNLNVSWYLEGKKC